MNTKGLASKLSSEKAHRLLVTLQVMELSIALMRQNIARKLPNASAAQIDAELRRWLIEQPEFFEVNTAMIVSS